MSLILLLSCSFLHVILILNFCLQCTVASKFLLLQESVRDAADLYLSLKYPPPLLICDTPCTLARHIDQRCPDVAEQLWGDNVGCFQKPVIGKSPIKVSALVDNVYPIHHLVNYYFERAYCSLAFQNRLSTAMFWHKFAGNGLKLELYNPSSVLLVQLIIF